MTTLEQTLAEFRESVTTNMPKEALATLNAAIDRLVSSGIAEQALKEGDTFPSFTLNNAGGEPVHSADLLARGPVIVTFYRGGWCPYCNLELRAYQQLLPQIEAAGGQLVAVSPELPDESLSVQEKNDLAFDVLSDSGNQLARQLGLVFTFDEQLRALYDQFQIDLSVKNGDDSWSLPMPATYVVDRQSRIALADVSADYTRRLEPARALSALSAL